MIMRSVIIVFFVISLSSRSQADALDQLVKEAAAAGLPSSHLTSKIREGRAKRIPEAKIRAVVSRLITHMERARNWLGRGASRKLSRRSVDPGLLIAVAHARLAGLSEDALKGVLAGSKKHRRARRVDALVDLHMRGYAVSECAGLVRRAPLRDVGSLGETLDAVRVSTGLTHAEVADFALKTIRTHRGQLGKAMSVLKKAIKIKKIPSGQQKPKVHPSQSKKKIK